ncbi:hypothetical protein RSp0717 [Ralstonia pseudosolanacearum GMI1000]|uniref:Uncharacterized protein n=1 Tax=Ralstonia nicotianae (strain ATCC BAA-1114 / GMI1000) TaxID=267608 RepID=Q8XRW4_RALN1|nr:hypothetical protein RSp0717 [Ralstonia pseudosolanacearum GMI1000]
MAHPTPPSNRRPVSPLVHAPMRERRTSLAVVRTVHV